MCPEYVLKKHRVLLKVSHTMHVFYEWNHAFFIPRNFSRKDNALVPVCPVLLPYGIAASAASSCAAEPAGLQAPDELCTSDMILVMYVGCCACCCSAVTPIVCVGFCAILLGLGNATSARSSELWCARGCTTCECSWDA